MTSKRFVYSFLVFLGATMALALYFFMIISHIGLPADSFYYQVNWEKEKELPGAMFTGQMHFEMRCVSCHGPQGKGGLLAPALDDDVWLHGANYDAIFHVISDGVPGTQMTGWRTKLQKDDVMALTLYVKSLQLNKTLYSTQKNPANPAKSSEPSKEQ